MKRIGDFLERFSKLAQESDTTRNQIVEILAGLGIRIKTIKNIKVRNGIATLGLSAIQKSEVALKQKKIIEELSKNPLTKNITVVR